MKASSPRIGHGHHFRNGREFAAWLGLIPENKSSRGKDKFSRITKMGEQYLRQLLVVGMTSLVRQSRHHPERGSKITKDLLCRSYPHKIFAAQRTNV